MISMVLLRFLIRNLDKGIFAKQFKVQQEKVERIRLRIRADFFANFISKTPEILINRMCEAINDFTPYSF